jgi:hypothetical protein
VSCAPIESSLLFGVSSRVFNRRLTKPTVASLSADGRISDLPAYTVAGRALECSTRTCGCSDAPRPASTLEQPCSQNCGRVGVLPRDQVPVLDHVGLPDLAAAEVDADLLLEFGLEQPRRLGRDPDGLLPLRW